MTIKKPVFFSDIQDLAEEREVDGAEPIDLWCPVCGPKAGSLAVLEEARVEEVAANIQILFVGRADLLQCQLCSRRFVFVTPYVRKMNGCSEETGPA